ncbi:hypothetical protein ACA910_001025 [Epithemia clementina (nom. ined.)]
MIHRIAQSAVILRRIKPPGGVVVTPCYSIWKKNVPHQFDRTPKNAQTTTTTGIRWHGGSAVGADAPTIQVTFIHPNGTDRSVVDARIGETLLQTAHRHDIDLEGACEGVCACSTCHLILPSAMYDNLPEPSEDEEDMLDMAFGLQETSRLGCQITVTPEMDGVELRMPAATRNFYVDGHKPKPH